MSVVEVGHSIVRPADVRSGTAGGEAEAFERPLELQKGASIHCQIAQYASEIVSAAPELNHEQAHRIRALIISSMSTE
jgi:hypothetical protein